MLFPLYSVLLFCLLNLASASPVKDSNAYRLARGLPPLPPRDFGRNKPGQQPTPVLRARANPSPSPSGVAQYSGRLQVRLENGSTVGYVQDKLGLPVSHGSDLQISVFASLTRKEDLNIIAAAPTAFPSRSHLGASSENSKDTTISADTSSSLLFTIVPKTPAMSRPIVLPTGNASVESAIWAINSTTKELTAQYVNPDGSLPKTFIMFNYTDDKLFFVGNTTSQSSSSAPVKLFIVT
ncbi:hypothetical protein BDP27DRAFT_1453144 [Rhodocollybia butyracea]|uniref:Uncharacterized protein n=1 Tax=Rhodocollybia butyracea TaxID=206335 RepID=A0A9P5PCM8_9AGAR|nr:hypothetical protein BDP27DRAFT_1453144 [Rhodocollybia butyracea]